MKSSMDNTILVTGGGGYVGSHTIVELLKNNYSIVVVDNLVNCYAEKGHKPESLKRVEQITGKTIIFYETDIRNKDAMDKIFTKHKFTTVLHFAGLKSVGESVNNPLTYYLNNVNGSCVLFEVMEQHHVKSLIYSSSATVYGVPQKVPISENHPTGQSCTNPYGRTKFFIEEILKDLCTADAEWKVILLRYFNPVGAHESGLIGEDPAGIPNNLMPYMAQVAVGQREMLHIFGNDYPTKDGTGVRDYIHITDLALGHLKALERLHHSDFKMWKAYNLGTGEGYSVLDLLTAFRNVSGKSIKHDIAPRRRGDVAVCYADPTLAKSELKWQARMGVSRMCEDTWRWQSQNLHGYRPK